MSGMMVKQGHLRRKNSPKRGLKIGERDGVGNGGRLVWLDNVFCWSCGCVCVCVLCGFLFIYLWCWECVFVCGFFVCGVCVCVLRADGRAGCAWKCHCQGRGMTSWEAYLEASAQIQVRDGVDQNSDSTAISWHREKPYWFCLGSSVCRWSLRTLNEEGVGRRSFGEKRRWEQIWDSGLEQSDIHTETPA